MMICWCCLEKINVGHSRWYNCITAFLECTLSSILDKKCLEFCSFLPTDAFPTDPIPLWPLPLPHPGQCCSVKDRNDPTRLQHICFGEEWRSINFVCSAFKSFILKLNKATSFFYVTFLSKIVASSQLATTMQAHGFTRMAPPSQVRQLMVNLKRLFTFKQ